MIQAVYRYETEPGKQSQVDFGEFGYVDMDGKRRKLLVFSIVLGYSRTRYAEFTVDISTEECYKDAPELLRILRWIHGYNSVR